MTVAKLAIDRSAIAAFCRRHHVRRLALFGSAVHGDFRPESDVDVLVEFQRGHTPGFALIGMQDELSEIVGRQVDLRTPECLSRYLRDDVLSQAEVLYEQT